MDKMRKIIWREILLFSMAILIGFIMFAFVVLPVVLVVVLGSCYWLLLYLLYFTIYIAWETVDEIFN